VAAAGRRAGLSPPRAANKFAIGSDHLDSGGVTVAIHRIVNPNMEPVMRKSIIIATAAVAFAGAAMADMAAPQFVTLQNSDMLSSNVVGLDVYDTADHKLGTVKDIAFDSSKAVKGYILSVGGLLGMGAHYVAVDIASVDIKYDAADKKWRANMNASKDQLKAAPEFKYEGEWNASKS
jgi:sporulation protein YlmC with PRC-barrel domain